MKTRQNRSKQKITTTCIHASLSCVSNPNGVGVTHIFYVHMSIWEQVWPHRHKMVGHKSRLYILHSWSTLAFVPFYNVTKTKPKLAKISYKSTGLKLRFLEQLLNWIVFYEQVKLEILWLLFHFTFLYFNPYWNDHIQLKTKYPLMQVFIDKKQFSSKSIT